MPEFCRFKQFFNFLKKIREAFFYRLGVFNPEYAPQAEIMLSLMEFEGKDKTLATIRENGRRLSAAKEALV